LDEYVYASQKIVLATGPGALSDLFEKPSQTFDASHFVQFANRVQYRRFVVVVPTHSVVDKLTLTIRVTLYDKAMTRNGDNVHNVVYKNPTYRIHIQNIDVVNQRDYAQDTI
jgi:hypothetical protein